VVEEGTMLVAAVEEGTMLVAEVAAVEEETMLVVEVAMLVAAVEEEEQVNILVAEGVGEKMTRALLTPTSLEGRIRTTTKVGGAEEEEEVEGDQMDVVVLAGGEPTAMKSERARSNNKRGMNLLHSEHYVDAVQTTLVGPVEQYIIHTITVDFNRLKIEIEIPKDNFLSSLDL
jgi:hypothetical protein